MLQKLVPVSMRRVEMLDGLLGKKMRINAEVTAPLMYERCRETGRVGVLRHWKWDGDPEQKPHPFWDSDIGKMIEGAACALILHPDPELENKIDRVIEQMEQLQEPDGYLNSYFQAAEPKSERFRNLYYMHELYCAGHLMEGAVAWYEATGKRRFLDLMIRYADLLVETFSDSGKARAGYCGHPEIELALVRLYRVTEDRRYLDLARCFLDRRGTEPYYFEQESLARGVDTTKTANQKRHLKDFLPSRGPYAEYQAHCPVRSQKEPVGHAVRAMYLYSGMADVANACEEQELLEACRTLWDRVVRTQYAIIGGIGPASDGERFTFAYDIPNEHTYNESCASVALVQWADRMLQLEADARYADILEQTLYNIIFGSVSEDGERFFYANYLSVYPPFYRHASKVLNDKRYAVRQPWFQVSCCPPNICRLLGSMGGRIASVSDGAVWIHQYTECRIDTCMDGQPLVLRMETGYPWDGRIVMTLGTACPVTGRILLRIPGWCGKYSLCVNHDSVEGAVEKGYLSIYRRWENNDRIELAFHMPAVLMQADPRVREDCGKAAVMRGPVVYCLEGVDNGEELSGLSIDPGQEMVCVRGDFPDMPEAVTILLKGFRLTVDEKDEGKLYRKADFKKEPVSIRAVPYFLWGNRGFSEMQVWTRVNGL